MQWFKISSNFWCNPKWLKVSDSAKALWVASASWSAQNDTFGEVPDTFLKTFKPVARPTKAAKELVDAGLWEVTPQGYRFHDWNDYNPSREEWEKGKTATKNRVKKHRQNQSANPVLEAVENEENQTPDAVDNSVEKEKISRNFEETSEKLQRNSRETSEKLQRNSQEPNKQIGLNTDQTSNCNAVTTSNVTLQEEEEEKEEEYIYPPYIPPKGKKSAPADTKNTTTKTDFETFWQAYRRHGNKKQAQKAFQKTVRQGYSPQWLTQQATQWHTQADLNQTPMQYRKQASTWLNNEAWNDTPPANHNPQNTLTKSQQAALQDLLKAHWQEQNQQQSRKAITK